MLTGLAPALEQNESATVAPLLEVVHVTVRVRVTPDPHVAEHPDHADVLHAYVGHAGCVHAWDVAGRVLATQSESATTAFPLAVFVHVTVRVCTPVPHVTLHVLNAPVLHAYEPDEHACVAAGFVPVHNESSTRPRREDSRHPTWRVATPPMHGPYEDVLHAYVGFAMAGSVDDATHAELEHWNVPAVAE
jgi:hypothetical protein